MMNFKKSALVWIFPIVLIGGVSVYIYKDLYKAESVDLKTEQGQTSGSSVVNAEKETGTISNTVSGVKKIVPKIPDLNREVTNLNHLDSDAFKAAIEGISKLSEDLKKDPTDAFKWFNLGMYRKIIGDYQGTIEINNYTALVWPTEYVSFNNLADLYQFSVKNYPLAEKNWLKVIELKPDYPEAYENLYNLYSGLYKEKQGQALPILLKGYANNPNSTDLMIYLARHYRTAGDLVNAKVYYDKAVAEAQAEKNPQLEATIRSEAGEIK